MSCGSWKSMLDEKVSLGITSGNYSKSKTNAITEKWQLEIQMALNGNSIVRARLHRQQSINQSTLAIQLCSELSRRRIYFFFYPESSFFSFLHFLFVDIPFQSFILRILFNTWYLVILVRFTRGHRTVGGEEEDRNNHGGTKWRTSWKAETWKKIYIFGVWEWMDGS